VTTSKFDVGGEAKIFTYQHTVADADSGGESLVVRVAETQDDLAIIASDALTSEGETAEVAQAATMQGVLFTKDGQPCVLNSVARQLDQGVVSDRRVRLRCLWCFHAQELLEVDFVFCDDELHSSSSYLVWLVAPVAAAGERYKIGGDCQLLFFLFSRFYFLRLQL
jgi:hypothetical protein